MMKETYSNQVQLLVRLLAYVQKETSLTLKGGTAINLFLRDIPRLSVDLDLVYLPIQERATSLKNINDALDRSVATRNRDFFDVEYIPQTGIMDDRLRTAFLVYLISHDRPLSELLAPNEKQLNEIRARFFAMILPWLTDGDREFLIGFKKGEPDWGPPRHRSCKGPARSAVEAAQPKTHETAGEACFNSPIRTGVGEILMAALHF